MTTFRRATQADADEVVAIVLAHLHWLQNRGPGPVVHPRPFRHPQPNASPARPMSQLRWDQLPPTRRGQFGLTLLATVSLGLFAAKEGRYCVASRCVTGSRKRPRLP